MLFPYLEAYLEVFTERGGAAAQLAVQTLVNQAMELIRAVTTVVRAVTHPVAGDAAVVPTLKLGGCAKLVCQRQQAESA